MIRTLSRLGSLVALALVLTAAGLTSGAAALASVGPTRIAPHQFFVGLVNGDSQNATVKVVCPGPSNIGRALPGQTLSVTSPQVVSRNDGYTGSKGRAIMAIVGPASAATDTVLFKRYNDVSAFPTDVPVPCEGTGIVTFSPVPGSKGAKSFIVTVSYANVAVGARTVR